MRLSGACRAMESPGQAASTGIVARPAPGRCSMNWPVHERWFRQVALCARASLAGRDARRRKGIGADLSDLSAGTDPYFGRATVEAEPRSAETCHSYFPA